MSGNPVEPYGGGPPPPPHHHQPSIGQIPQSYHPPPPPPHQQQLQPQPQQSQMGVPPSGYHPHDPMQLPQPLPGVRQLPPMMTDSYGRVITPGYPARPMSPPPPAQGMPPGPIPQPSHSIPQNTSASNLPQQVAPPQHPQHHAPQHHHIQGHSAPPPPQQQHVAAPPPQMQPAAVPPLNQPRSEQDGNYRPLNVKDALSYLDQVKLQFQDQPDVYNRFLDIMKDFKSQSIDTPGVIERVSTLFRGHPALIMGFNTFLPPGYRIEAGLNAHDPIRVITPSGMETEMPGHILQPQYGPVVGQGPPPQPTYVHGAPQQVYNQPPANGTAYPHQGITAQPTGTPQYAVQQAASSSAPAAAPAPVADDPNAAARKAPVEFNHAINYVNKIKNRYSHDPDTYKTFLEILQTYQKESKPIQEVYAQVQILFKGAPDLLDEFKQFLPDNGSSGSTPPSGRGGQAPRMPPLGSFAATSGDGRRGGNQAAPSNSKKGIKRTTSQLGPPPAAQSSSSSQPAPKKRAKAGLSSSSGMAGSSSTVSLPLSNSFKVLDTMEELEWIDRCKRVLSNKATYNEFLKILNLFSQEIIDSRTLVERLEPFLGRTPELYEWLKKSMNYEETPAVSTSAEKPDIDLRSCKKVGHSYRLLPSDMAKAICSGRDELCRETLNDDWISQPEYVSETGFVAHKKTQYEEALHKCEEERYEFDLNIEANLHTIALLEPIYKRIQGMTSEERSKYKLPVGLGGTSTTIYQRIIKKVYDVDRGLEVIEALHENPCVAVPIVLKRLKQKDEEWKRCQREWNKVWRDIDMKNYYKALDHQGINFKASDKKAISSKALLTEIENIYREQREKRVTSDAAAGQSNSASLLSKQHQMDFKFNDSNLFREIRRMIKRQANSTTTISTTDEDRIADFLGTFVRKFFFVEEYDDLYDPDMQQDDSSSDEEGDSQDETASSQKSERAKFVTSRAAKVEAVAMDVDSQPATAANGSKDVSTLDEIQRSASPTRRSSYSFYANNAFFVFIRLYQMLYSRLLKMSELSKHLASQPPCGPKVNPIAIELGLRTKDPLPDAFCSESDDRYQDLLKAIDKLFKGKMESSDYEDRCRYLFGTSGYLMFTIDRLVQAIVKQIQAIQSDPRCLDLIGLYMKDRDKASTNSRQEAVYRLNAEGLIQDDMLYRIEYFVGEKVLTIQLLGKEDPISDETVSSEERWSLYVDHFIQLSTTQGIRMPHRREPFLRRNLPLKVPDEPPSGVETRSGLELKICINTYKIFFVENTEDYFCRRSDRALWMSDKERREKALARRREAFQQWLKRRERGEPEEPHKPLVPPRRRVEAREEYEEEDGDDDDGASGDGDDDGASGDGDDAGDDGEGEGEGDGDGDGDADMYQKEDDGDEAMNEDDEEGDGEDERGEMDEDYGEDGGNGEGHAIPEDEENGGANSVAEDVDMTA
ncbi:Transcriptional regulatory protein sin3 [Chytridiales sp. JEL 0842]|nr:Transcriptional regulatory protein sin3 [Chytridiales sp. JEL 0842]